MSPARRTKPILATPPIAVACAVAAAALAGCKGGAPDAAADAPVVTTASSEAPRTSKPADPVPDPAKTNSDPDLAHWPNPAASSEPAATSAAAASSPATLTPSAPPAPAAAMISDPFDSHPPLSRVMLASGLLLEDLVIGAGSICADPAAKVTVRYTGRLRSGVVFDWTPPGKPVELPLEELIPGWREGVPGMRIGGKRRLTIPADLGYGRRGLTYGNQYIVPPDSDLIFEIELLGVKE